MLDRERIEHNKRAKTAAYYSEVPDAPKRRCASCEKNSRLRKDEDGELVCDCRSDPRHRTPYYAEVQWTCCDERRMGPPVRRSDV